MHNFQIHFTYPWLLLLLIPAAALTVFLYLRVNKKYRNTRNRVISTILHSIVMVLAILVLAGINFTYEVTNLDNAIILLVDVSDTEQAAEERRDDFIENFLAESSYDDYKVGVVTFGFTQEYAVPLTYDVDGIFNAYLEADLPDVSATDIASALLYTRDLFSETETKKIVLITDGKETDETAMSVIRSFVKQKITVDTVYVPSEFSDDNVQITGVTLPDYHVSVGQECEIGVEIYSKTAVEGAVIEILDNGVLDPERAAKTVDLVEGSQVVNFRLVFEDDDVHELAIKITEGGDSLEDNNQYCSYVYLEVYNDILIIEHADGESEKLVQLLGEAQVPDPYEVTVVGLHSENKPITAEQLRAYDQVILNNISNADLATYAAGFDTELYKYVNEYGGGLLTVGGSDEEGNAHAYNRGDMNNTTFQQMLPVQAINYTPPVGVIVIIDISGSMAGDGGDGLSKLDWAKDGAIACLDALTERDYIGIMTLDSVFSTILPLTPCTQESLIKERILSDIESTGSTVFSEAIDRAGQALVALSSVDKRHIIIVTDGEPTESEPGDYLNAARKYYDSNGVTLSVVGINIAANSSAAKKMQELVDAAGGRLHTVPVGHALLEEMREDLNAPEIKETNNEPFHPLVQNALSPLLKGVNFDPTEPNRKRFAAELGGFYGVKARASADLVLVGDYEVPIYAQWKFGRGTVGSFMCDLQGVWSSEFMADPDSRQFLFNVVEYLMPTENIEPNDIRISLKAENYINQLSVFTDLGEGEKLTGELALVTGNTVYNLGEITQTEDGDLDDLPFYVLEEALNQDNNYSRCKFVLKESGVYRITVRKFNAAGEEIGRAEYFKTFSYSKEYTIPDETQFDPSAFLAELSERGGGIMLDDLEDPSPIFETFDPMLDRSYDPRLLFMIIAMVLFLLDVAVRKFKFKWIHELVHDYKERKALEAGSARKGGSV